MSPKEGPIDFNACYFRLSETTLEYSVDLSLNKLSEHPLFLAILNLKDRRFE